MPWLSVIIPTIGRPSLERALLSVRRQAPSRHVDIVVVLDGHTVDGMARDRTRWLCRVYDARYHECDAGYSHWGHPQCQIGMSLARGDYLAFLGDDDVFLGGAIGQVWDRVVPVTAPAVHLFRAEMPRLGATVWRLPALAHGDISGQNIVVPNVPGMLGAWGGRSADAHPSGDWEFIESTCRKWGDRVIWQDLVTVRCR